MTQEANYKGIPCTSAAYNAMMWFDKIIQEQSRLQDGSPIITQHYVGSMKTMYIDIPEYRFFLDDESNRNEYVTRATLPLIALAHLRTNFSDIIKDLRDDNSYGKFYWSDGSCIVKQEKFRTFNTLCFIDQWGNFVSIRERTFRKMLRCATGEQILPDENLEGLRRLEDNNNLAPNKSIEFSDDCTRFEITNKYGESYNLPTTALDTLVTNVNNILKDFDDSTRFDGERGFFNEYWSNDEFSIHTGRLVNSNRDVDENVLRFVRNNQDYIFVITQHTFLKMLNLFMLEKNPPAHLIKSNPHNYSFC